MKPLLVLALVMTLYSCNENQNTVPLYIGTYTSGDSEGIYKLNFNTETGMLTNLTLAATIGNPSFIAYSPNQKYMYAVNEADHGTVSSFRITETGHLTLINTVKSFGGAPCHISVNDSGTKLAASNYSGGNIALYDINEDGSLTEASQVFDHNLPNEKSHAHSAQFFKDVLFVADLGRNAMYKYIKNDTDAYTLKDSSFIKMTPNAGPRHFTFTKNADFIYVINEYASTITAAKKTGNTYEVISNTSTLADGFTDRNDCADIHLSNNEEFLYGSNRGENTIAVFRRDLINGNITKIQNASVHGNWPRNFTLSPDGKFLLVANQKSDNISVFKINDNDGTLSFLHDINIPTPVCLLF
ncbi:hypothetical protein PK35_03315 [Tamlana nanhaiensis]|uniref:6-phosphogluconolactonase n=1 Tax=Neotamlana nanhaiensis TaxID=1382798 RepID=A0A0D7W3V5_9FLAO|nr:lactonase family protein [Tamlana nanhaiensis]KJD33795.1 hypothetical protein PK35_03315 [Tamlana nanhaiensis]